MNTLPAVLCHLTKNILYKGYHLTSFMCVVVFKMSYVESNMLKVF